jgi:prevent-host-death family protein
MEWQFADAKNRLSELINRALTEGPQRVLRREDAVVVVAERDYEKLTRCGPGLQGIPAGQGAESGGRGSHSQSFPDAHCETLTYAEPRCAPLPRLHLPPRKCR